MSSLLCQTIFKIITKVNFKMNDIHEIEIKQVMEHWQVYINGEFFCSADSYNEAVNEIKMTYGK